MMHASPGSSPSPAAAALDARRLRGWLADTLPGIGDEIRLEKIGGGQSNPTFVVDAGHRRLVLRKQPPGPLLPSAHAVDREYRIQRALATTDVPVPRVLAYCDDAAIIGTPFYVMEHLTGRVLPGCALPEVPAAKRAAHIFAMAETLARLHAVDWASLGLADYGKAGNFFERQIARWSKQWNASKAADNPDIERLCAWLPANVPAGDVTTIAHGDYRIGNLMYDPAEPRVIAVLDWELSTLGHPLADLAYCCMAWHTRPHEFHGIRGLDLEALGIPSEREFVAHYQRHSVRELRLRPFHLAFSMFRFAVILEGVAARARAGNAASADASEVGAKAAAFARRACELIDAG